MSEFKFKTEPFQHQLEEFQASCDKEFRGSFWEQGTGKSKLVLDTAAKAYIDGRIDTLFVLAPNGVHTNWITDECPTHLACKWRGAVYHSKKASTKRHEREIKNLFDEEHRLVVIAFSYDGFMTPKGKKWAQKFIKQRRCLFVADESQRLKNATAKRTITAMAAAKYAPMRRILSGTPVTKSPFDVYTQMKVLDQSFWKARGFASAEAFKTYFGVFRQVEIPEDEDTGRRARKFMKCVAYRNLDELAELLAEASSRVVKAEVLDLPDKLYKKIYVELTPDQRSLYKQIKEEFLVELHSGDRIEAPLMLTRMLRFQQILSGYIPNEDGELLYLPENPRLRVLLDTLEDIQEGKVIIFSRFTSDIEQIVAALNKKEETAVHYYGATSIEERQDAKDRFQDPDSPIRFFVGNPAACATGLTLTQARTVVYYANDFNLEYRLQSEDRAHRIGQKHAVTYIDLVARGTIDTHIVQALRNKLNIAQVVQGDNVKDWI